MPFSSYNFSNLFYIQNILPAKSGMNKRTKNKKVQSIHKSQFTTSFSYRYVYETNYEV